jgi:phospholipid/cholesterol/gamma-HCH transport system permease protein
MLVSRRMGVSSDRGGIVERAGRQGGSGMASESRARHFDTPFHLLGRWVLGFLVTIGDLSLFTARMLRWMMLRLPKRAVLLQSFYQIGVLSVPVVVVTGAFIGLVLAVQTYDQLRLMRLETQLGAVINLSLVRELGPVLAATMLAGRVGSAMAAEIGTMRVTEQIDALRALGADPIQSLADLMGVISGWFIATQIFQINEFHYWLHSRQTVSAYDVYCGLLKSMFFGAAIAIVSCHRGFHCSAGAQGVGRAATQAFVFSFAVILVLDFVLAIFLNDFYYVIWPSALGS